MNRYLEYFMATAVRIFMKKTVKYCQIRKQKKILLICRHPLGDTVLESPLLRGIRNTYPEYHITVVGSKENYGLLEYCPYIDQLLVYDSKVKGSFLKGNLKKVYRFVEENLRGLDYEIGIIPCSSMPAIIEAWLLYFSGARQRITYSERFNPIMHREYMGGYDRYFTDVIFDKEIKHEVERNLELLSYINGEEEDTSLELWTNADDRLKAECILKQGNLDNDAIKVIVNLSTSEKNRDWPVENYIEVCSKLNENYRVEYILIGAGCTADEYSSVFKQAVTSNVYDLIGKTSIRELIEIMKMADFYLGGDTGPLHFAAACHLRGVAIYKSAENLKSNMKKDDKLRYPWHTDISILHPNSYLPGCEYGCNSEAPHCIKQVSVEVVYEAVDKQLKTVERKKEC